MGMVSPPKRGRLRADGRASRGESGTNPVRHVLLRALDRIKALTGGRRYKPEKAYMRGARDDRPAGPIE